MPRTFEMKFAQVGLHVEPAGKDVNNKADGHFHIIVDGAFIPEGEVIAVDSTHIHYGKGQTAATLTLSPGLTEWFTAA